MDAVMENRAEKLRYRDCYGNSALLDIAPDGSTVLIVNPTYRKSSHGRPQQTLVHYFKTEWAARQAMRDLSGTTWTEVSRECQYRY